MQNLSGLYFTFGEWMFKLFILNFIWIIFSVLGLGLIGIFPATAALYATIRNDSQAEGDIKLFNTFRSYFFQEILRANLYGYSFLIAGSILLLNIRVLGQLPGSILNSSFMLFTYGLLIFLLLISIYFLPVYVHFQLPFTGYLKYSLVLVIGKPLSTLALVISVVVILYGLYRLPILLPVLGVSLIAYLIMKITLPLFAEKPKENI